MLFTYQYPHPAVAADACLFTVQEAKLKILLIRRADEPYKGDWALPGGFVNIDETLEQAVQRELEEETGASGFYFEQLEAFGAVDRDPRERVISVAYVALAPAEHIKLKADSDASEVAWFAIDSLPDLAFDHATMVSRAVQRVRAKLEDSRVAFEFLPKAFTVSDLQQVYEAIQGAAIDKRNFRKWLAAQDLIEPTGKKRSGSHRPAELFRLKAKKRRTKLK
jgi:8-oxo-dGTP diphosphatase